MISRRNMVQLAAAWGSLAAASAKSAYAAAGDRSRSGTLAGTVSEADLLRFRPRGQITLLHMTDCHAQLEPIYLREPKVNVGVGAVIGEPPHITDKALLSRFNVDAGSWRAYALSSADFEPLARAWGRVGGMDRMASLVKAIRAERGPDRVLFLDGGDTLQGSYTALQSRGGDMVRVMQTLGVEATTGHWEFTLGAERVAEIFGTREQPGTSGIPFLAGNVVENEFDEPVFYASREFEKGGVRVAVIGQAFPYTPISNPRWMIPRWSMGIREAELQRNVAAVRAGGADVVVLLSHNGFNVDRKLAGLVQGIDVILTGHSHDALPEPLIVGQTLLIGSGSHGKFLSRLDLEVKGGRVAAYNYALIPVLADAIRPDPAMASVIESIRSPHQAMLGTELATTGTLLYRRDTFSGTLDDVLLAAMLEERGAEIALSPGFRWGTALLAGQPITWEDIYNATAITYPGCWRTMLMGSEIKDVLEDVADNAFNPDPYYQQGGDMVRVGGLRYAIDCHLPMGARIQAMELARTGEPIDPARSYAVAGWGSVNEGVEGPPIWDLVAAYLARHKTVAFEPGRNPVDLAIARPNPNKF